MREEDPEVKIIKPAVEKPIFGGPPIPPVLSDAPRKPRSQAIQDLPEGLPIKTAGFCPNCDKPRNQKQHGPMLSCRCGGSVVNDMWYPKGTDLGALLAKIQGSKKQRRRHKKRVRQEAVRKQAKAPKPFVGGRKRKANR